MTKPILVERIPKDLIRLTVTCPVCPQSSTVFRPVVRGEVVRFRCPGCHTWVRAET